MSVWDGFIGHPRCLSALQSAARRPIGTYLLVGPAGAGKRGGARILAAALICPAACGRCHACSRVLRDLHPDVAVLQPEGYTFAVEALRDAGAAAARTPLEAACRVFVVEEAERIPERSQNALLKALEEPGPSVVWILLATSTEMLLPTILSRCQTIEFPPVAEDALSRLLQARFQISRAQAEGHIRAARGDPQAALKLAGDTPAAELRRRALELSVRPALPVASLLQEAEAVKEMASGLKEASQTRINAELAAVERSCGPQPASWTRKVTDRNKRVLRRLETEVFIDYLSWLGAAFRDLAVASSGGPEEALAAHDFADRILPASSGHPPGFWIDMVERCLQGQAAIKESSNPALVTESVLLHLTS